MIGRTLSLRFFALIFAFACAIFVIIAGYRALLVSAGPLWAPIFMAVLCAVAALSFLGLTQLRASRRNARLRSVVANLIDHKPMAALAAAVVAGAAARFGIEPEDLFPIFEAFNPAAPVPSPDQEADSSPDPSPPSPPTPRPHPNPPQPSVH